jgi:hypothetical protein
MACPVPSKKPSKNNNDTSSGVGESQRELFYRLMNPDDHPDVASQARDLAVEFLEQARRLRRDTPGADFGYSPEALEAFLWADYDRAMAEYAAYSRAVEQGRVEIIPRDDMAFYLVQVAPAKLVDGSWLQNVCKCQHLSTDARLNRILSNLFVIYSGSSNLCDCLLRERSLPPRPSALVWLAQAQSRTLAHMRARAHSEADRAVLCEQRN